MPKKTTKKDLKRSKYESSPKKGEKEIGKDRIDRTIRKRTFQYYDRPTIGVEFYIFRKIGDEISGQIIGHAITNIRRNSSYPLKLESGRVIEFFANKQLHGIIRDFELIFSHVRIVYIGRNHQNWGGHSAKVYRVYNIKDGLESGSLVKKKGAKKNGQ